MHLLHFTFPLHLPARDIAGFRAALARTVGFDQDLFHNHEQETGKLHYRYPLVQYRSERGRAAILGMNEGAEAVLKWYATTGGTLVYNNKEMKLPFDRMDAKLYDIRHDEPPRRYRLHQWLPLNQQRYAQWQNMPGLADRVHELERLLAAHILTFCRAVEWRLPRKFDLSIIKIDNVRKKGFLGVPHVAFDITFDCNLRLPFGIGLGKAVSHGFGVCKPVPVRRKSHPISTAVPAQQDTLENE